MKTSIFRDRRDRLRSMGSFAIREGTRNVLIKAFIVSFHHNQQRLQVCERFIPDERVILELDLEFKTLKAVRSRRTERRSIKQ